jgi:hypothetical protein
VPPPFAGVEVTEEAAVLSVDEVVHRTDYRRARAWSWTLQVAPELPKPDVRPQLRELLAWYDDVLGRIAGGALVAPGVAERLGEEREFTARYLELLDAGEESSLATE